MSLSPALYHGHHHTYTEDLPFWLELAQRSPGPILELGCGTGRVLLPLLEHGLAAYGLDNDPLMLAYLRYNTPPSLRPALRLVQADLTAPPFAARAFGLILLPCNTFSLLSAPERHRTLRAVARCLRPGGRFAFSLPNAAYLRRLPPEEASEPEAVFYHPETGNPVQVSSAWKVTATHFELTWHYDHLWPDGEVERFTVHQRHHLLDRSSVESACRQAGLVPISCYGAFDGSPYHEESPYLILVTRRR